jgi:glyoxylase-like metal-dependent hydrolase (beta-lactamase superfamily II)
MKSRYRISSVEGNRQRLDGGAMFGNAPRALWQRWIEADSRHRIELACRAFLIHDLKEDRRILLEAGVGFSFEPKLRDRFGVEVPNDGDPHLLLANLKALGVASHQIDQIVISHLHFDHAGGLLSTWCEDAPAQLVFENAEFIVGQKAWERARAPHLRDKASFLPHLNDLLEASGRLRLVEAQDAAEVLGTDFGFHLSDGHTPGMLLTELKRDGQGALFCGDLVPGAPWVHLPITMGYDRFPEGVIDEKKILVGRAQQQGIWLLFAHDPDVTACRVGLDQRGRYCSDQATSGAFQLDL